MPLVGFYAANCTDLAGRTLAVTNHAVAGAIFYELATVVTGMPPRSAPARVREQPNNAEQV
jgi:hypothetical protein